MDSLNGSHRWSWQNHRLASADSILPQFLPKRKYGFSMKNNLFITILNTFIRKQHRILNIQSAPHHVSLPPRSFSGTSHLPECAARRLQADPAQGSGNFLIDREGSAIWCTEKTLFSEPVQDLEHFLAPTLLSGRRMWSWPRKKYASLSQTIWMPVQTA